LLYNLRVKVFLDRGSIPLASTNLDADYKVDGICLNRRIRDSSS